jgi:hypothetical protein
MGCGRIVRPGPVVEGAAMSNRVERETCVFCESDRLFHKRATITGRQWPVCKSCASVGRTLWQEGAIDPVRHCLHLMAMEFEAFPYDLPVLDFVWQRWLLKLRRKLRDGEFRQACTCDGCNGRPVAGVMGDLFVAFDVDGETFADTVPLNVLRSMPDGTKLTASDGTIWRACDEVARRMVAGMTVATRPALSPLAQSAIPASEGEWVERLDTATGEVRPMYVPIDAQARRRRDDAARAHWAAFKAGASE